MASYYYLISSLPLLKTQGEPPLDYAAFLSMCRSAVSGSVYKTLEELTAGLELRPSKKVGAGFRLAAKDGSGYFDCSEQEIANMLTPFFRDMRL